MLGAFGIFCCATGDIRYLYALIAGAFLVPSGQCVKGISCTFWPPGELPWRLGLALFSSGAINAEKVLLSLSSRHVRSAL